MQQLHERSKKNRLILESDTEIWNLIRKIEMNKKDRIYYGILKLFVRLLGFVPRKAGRTFAKIIGHLWFAADKRHRTVTIENISYAFAGEMKKVQARILAKKVFSHFILFAFEVAWYLRVDLDDFHNHFEIKGFENLKNAYSKNRGIIFLTGHIGVWELATFFKGKTGIPANIVYRPIRFIALNQFINDTRLRFGGHVFPVKKALAHVKKALAHKEALFLLMDQSTKSKKGSVVNFMNRKTFANKGIAMLAMESGAPVVPLFIVRGKSKYLIIIKPEIPLASAETEEENIEINTQNYTSAIEDIVRKYPDQYFWLHNRWKYQPGS